MVTAGARAPSSLETRRSRSAKFAVLTAATILLWLSTIVWPEPARPDLDPSWQQILVDEYSQTSVAGIHAVGDATDRKNLTPVAIAEGRALAETLFGTRRLAVAHSGVPSAVFSQPPVGTVGLSEEEDMKLKVIAAVAG